MLRSRLNKTIAHWLQGWFGKGLPEVAPPARGQTIHVIILDGTMSSLDPGCETNAGLTYKLFNIALLYIDDIEDDSIAHLDPIENLSKKEIRQFFEKKIRADVGTG